MTLIGEGKIKIICPCGCKNILEKYRSATRKFFAKGCVQRYNSQNPLERKRYESHNMKIEKELIDIHHNEAKQHRETIFTGGFDDGDLVTYTEGEIL